MTSEVVGYEVKVAAEVVSLHSFQKPQIACGVARRSIAREHLTIPHSQSSVDPDLSQAPAVFQWGIDAMTVYRPTGSRPEAAGAHWTQLVEANYRGVRRWVLVRSTTLVLWGQTADLRSLPRVACDASAPPNVAGYASPSCDLPAYRVVEQLPSAHPASSELLCSHHGLRAGGHHNGPAFRVGPCTPV
jgi:hypothetical protein